MYHKTWKNQIVDFHILRVVYMKFIILELSKNSNEKCFEKKFSAQFGSADFCTPIYGILYLTVEKTLKITETDNKDNFKKGRVNGMKGYFVTDGYMGMVDGVYRLFADESDYYEYMND